MNADSCGAATVVETHISWIFLVGDRAWKLKKPVRLPFVDYSTRESRLEACRAEVALNRRLAPDVYLGVADVVGPDGTPCDHLVVMRRMPDGRRLSNLAVAGAPLAEEVGDIARKIAAFHGGMEPSSDAAEAASADALLAHWEEAVSQLAADASVDPVVVGTVAGLARRYIAGRRPLFAARIASGMARDGHGDLQAADIYCLDDGPRILDCIDFDAGLRHGDVLLDVAFLVMDLERLGRPELADELLRRYAEHSGGHHPDSLLHHFVAYRATVRAKVAAVRHAEGLPDAGADGSELLALALDHLERGRVRMILVGGLPGTGKTTLAGALGEALDVVVLSSDEIRKEILGVGPECRLTADFGEGAYADDVTARAYRELLRRADELTALGESVVLDASWSDATWRREAGTVAEATATDVVAIECVAPLDVTSARIEARLAAGGDASDATPSVAAAMAARWAPWPEALAIDTTLGIEPALDHILAPVADAARERSRNVS